MHVENEWIVHLSCWLFQKKLRAPFYNTAHARLRAMGEKQLGYARRPDVGHQMSEIQELKLSAGEGGFTILSVFSLRVKL